jgi:hypothetical protein
MVMNMPPFSQPSTLLRLFAFEDVDVAILQYNGKYLPVDMT